MSARNNANPLLHASDSTCPLIEKQQGDSRDFETLLFTLLAVTDSIMAKSCQKDVKNKALWNGKKYVSKQ